MIAHARGALLADRVGGAVQPASALAILQQAAQRDTLNLWSDAELTVFANQAVDEVATRTQCLSDRGTVDGVTQFALTALGSPEVLLDRRLLQVTRVTFDDQVLNPISLRWLDGRSRSWRDFTGTPDHFVVDDNALSLRVVPAQSVAGTLRLEAIHRPLTLMVAADDEPEIPLHLRADAVLWMCHLAYLKNDADTALPGASTGFSALFDQRFGPAPNAMALVRQMQASTRGRPRLYYH